MAAIPQWTAPEVARLQPAKTHKFADLAAKIDKECQKTRRAARDRPFAVVCTFDFAEALRTEGLSDERCRRFQSIAGGVRAFRFQRQQGMPVAGGGPQRYWRNHFSDEG